MEDITKKLSIEDKVNFVIGKDNWHLFSKPDLGIKEIKVNDGPHGLRVEKENETIGVMKESHTATCFPTLSLAGCSFNRELLHKMGEEIAHQAKAFNTAVVLGPGVNIKRNPLCGRNFEYISEDPYLIGELATSYINGVQENGIGTSIKHYALNSQETLRTSVNSVIDERTMREIYLFGFEKALKEAKPYTIMASYNMVNGTYACENKYLLKDLLRDEFKYDGVVVSDWGAVNSISESIKNGLDLEMPCSVIDKEKALKYYSEHKEDEKYLDESVEHVLSLIEKCNAKEEILDLEKGHEIAKEIALDSIVLLRNEDNILPISKDEKVLVVGEFARTPRYQGGGSSHINSHKVNSFLDVYPYEFDFEVGFSFDQSNDEKLKEEAITKAKKSNKILFFMGLTEKEESEGFDRKNMKLPSNQLSLLNEILKVNKNIVVILENGSAVEMPFKDEVKGIVECYLGGEAINDALSEILIGKVSPSGRLTETFAKNYEDYPSSPYYLKDDLNAYYKESIFVGYRYFTSTNKEVNYLFGDGLSYAKFELSDFEVNQNDKDLEVSVKVKNKSEYSAKEVIELYITKPNDEVFNAKYELKGFDKKEVKPGEEVVFMFRLKKEDFAFFDRESHSYKVQTGTYLVSIGETLSNLFASKEVEICGDFGKKPTKNLLNNYFKSTISEISDEEFASLFNDNKLPLVKEKKVGEYDLNTSLTIALKDSKGAKEIYEFLSERTVLKYRPSLLKILADLPVRSMGNNFGIKSNEILNTFVDAFNDVEVEKNSKVVIQIFENVINSFKRK